MTAMSWLGLAVLAVLYLIWGVMPTAPQVWRADDVDGE
jgi:hypothetical protein